MRFLAMICSVWVGATAFVLAAAWLLRHLKIDSLTSSWILAGCIVSGTAPVFFYFVPEKRNARGQTVVRLVLAAALSVMTYFVAIYVAYAVGTFLFGD